MLVLSTNIALWVLHTNGEIVEDLFKMLEKKHREDILFIERQIRMFEALTKKRVEMIKAIMEKHPASIRELANILDRDVKNVFDDLRLLNKMNIIDLTREGRCVKPVVKKKIVIIKFG